MIAYDRLKSMIPDDQALANKALSVSLGQITGITNLELPTFAVAVAGMKTTTDLPLVQALTTAVPPATAQYYINTLGVPGAENPNLEMVDILGTPTGYVHTNAFADVNNQISLMNVTALQEIYQQMANVVNGVFGDPATGPVDITSGPGIGNYTNGDDAILALIALAQAQIVSLNNTYPVQCQAMNDDFVASANQIRLERTIQGRANLDFAQLVPNEQNSTYGLIFSLPNYAIDIAPGGMNDFITAIADTTNLPGQAIVASLREGSDQILLSAAGIGTNSDIPL